MQSIEDNIKLFITIYLRTLSRKDSEFTMESEVEIRKSKANLGKTQSVQFHETNKFVRAFG